MAGHNVDVTTVSAKRVGSDAAGSLIDQKLGIDCDIAPVTLCTVDRGDDGAMAQEQRVAHGEGDVADRLWCAPR